MENKGQERPESIQIRNKKLVNQIAEVFWDFGGWGMIPTAEVEEDGGLVPKATIQSILPIPDEILSLWIKGNCFPQPENGCWQWSDIHEWIDSLRAALILINTNFEDK